MHMVVALRKLLTLCLCLISFAAYADNFGPPLKGFNQDGFGQDGFQQYNGNTGFLTGITSTNVSMLNLLPGSYDLSLATGHWTANNGGGAAAPTTTTVSDTLPDSTTGNVTELTIPIVTGANHYSTIHSGALSTVNANPVGFGVWAKMMTTGTGTGCQLWLTESVGTTFKRAAITSTSWTQITGSIPTGSYTTVQFPDTQIGINLFDASQSASNGSCVVRLSGAYIVKKPYDSLVSYSDVKQGGPIATTTTFASGGSSKTLPTYTRTGGGTGTIAFRDFSRLTVVNPQTSPMIAPNAAEVWQNGGVANPWLSQDFTSGGFYWGWTNCTSTATHLDWLSLCLYKSPTTGGTAALSWTEDTTAAPYFLPTGAILSNPSVAVAGSGFTASASGTATWTGGGCSVAPVIAVTTTSGGAIATATPSPNNGVGTGACPNAGWPHSGQTTWSYSGVGAGSGASYTFASVKGTGSIQFFVLHPAWLPYGCNVSGTSFSFCMVFAALGSGGLQNVYLGYSNTIDSGYTLLGCTSGQMACASPTVVIGGAGTSSIPAGLSAYNVVTVKNVGGSTGTNYLYAPCCSLNGTQSNYFTTSANSATSNAGVNWVYQGQVLPPTISGVDWDYGTTTYYQDHFIFLNHCGFYEMFYTAENPSGNVGSTGAPQVVGYAISNSQTGPWYKYQVGPIIPGTSTLWPYPPYLGGDSAVIELNNNFIYTGNYDDASLVSGAVAATMPQGTCP